MVRPFAFVARRTDRPPHGIADTRSSRQPDTMTDRRSRRRRHMGIGPVEYMVVAFPGNKFNGEILPAIAEQVEAGTIRIIDLAFVSKDAEGNVTALEVSDLDSQLGQAFHELLSDDATGGLLNEEGMMAVAEELEPNFSAGLLVWGRS